MSKTRLLAPMVALAATLFAAIPTAQPASGDLVVVAGANGRTGRLVVEQLVAGKWKVRALVRDAAKAGDLGAKGVEVKIADVRDPKSLAAALTGATYVISAIGASGGFKTAMGDGPQEVDFHGVSNLALAAKAAKVRQLVLISSLSTSKADSNPSAFMRPVLKAKFDGEQALRASGVPYTVVRPGGLVDEPGGGSVAFGQGDTLSGRIPRADVARVSIAALGRKSALGKTFEIVSGEAQPPGDWDVRFAALAADAPVTAAP